MQYTEMQKLKDNKDKIDLLLDFARKQTICSVHTYDLGMFDCETTYTKLSKEEIDQLVYKYVGIDWAKLQKEMLHQLGIE